MKQRQAEITNTNKNILTNKPKKIKVYHWIDKNGVPQTQNYSGSVLMSSDILTNRSGDLKHNTCFKATKTLCCLLKYKFRLAQKL